MTWTTTPPTAPGWYWFRHTRLSDAQCVQVVGHEDGAARVWLMAVDRPLKVACGEWAGPIVPPQERDGGKDADSYKLLCGGTRS